MYPFYRLLTLFAGPFLPALLRHRLRRGKEDDLRLRERLGFASAPRPAGNLLWVHAASMGESLSALPLIEAFLTRHPGWHVLITTVTVTSASAMQQRLLSRTVHQFAPLDHPAVLSRFLSHWKPDLTFWIESELWPNMVQETRKHCPMYLINARMSERSFRRWQVIPSFARDMLGSFLGVFAQSRTDADRFTALGAKGVEYKGNLKYDTPPLGCDESVLVQLRRAIGDRPVWLAASTHEGEEIQIASVHRELKAQFPDLLTFIVPRHAPRGALLTSQLREQHFVTVRRSGGEPITSDTEIYLADTMGELGLFYRLSPIVFMGGSLVPHGGQNMLEAARLGCAVITGPHTQNFTAICDELEQEGALLRVSDARNLQECVSNLLADNALRRQYADAALESVSHHSGIVDALLNSIQLPAVERHS